MSAPDEVSPEALSVEDAIRGLAEQGMLVTEQVITLAKGIEKVTAVVIELRAQLAEVDARLSLIRPVVHNCPRCTRKVGATDTACGMCGAQLRLV